MKTGVTRAFRVGGGAVMRLQSVILGTTLFRDLSGPQIPKYVNLYSCNGGNI